MDSAFLTELSSCIDGHLNQFSGEYEEPEKKGMGIVRGGLLAAGGAALAGGLLKKKNLLKYRGRKMLGKPQPLPKTWAPQARPNPTFGEQLSARIDAQLQEFAEIPLCDSTSEGCGYGYAPTLHIYGKTDPALHKLPNSGQAKVTYKLKRKTVDIRDNGEERYGAEIAIEGIEAVELEAVLDKYEFGLTLEQTLARMGKGKGTNLLNSAMKGNRGAQKAWRNRQLGAKPLKQVKGDADFMIESSNARGAAIGRSPMSAEDQKRFKRHWVKKAVNDNMRANELSEILDKYALHDFGDRARDNGGRFATGQDVSVGEMADAYLTPERKKKATMIAGAGAGIATAAVLGRTKISQVSPRIGQAAARMIMR